MAALAACANGIRIDVRQECQEAWDEKQNTDGQRLTLQDVIKTVDAVELRRAHLQLVEVEEETWVADTVAAKLALEFSCELFKAVANLSHLSLIVGVLVQLSQLKVVQVLVTVPEVVIGNGSSSAVDKER